MDILESIENAFYADATMLEPSRYEELRIDMVPKTINDESEQTEEKWQSSEDAQLRPYWPLYRLMQKKNWPAVENFVTKHRDALTAKIDTKKTLLELIIRFGGYEAPWLIDRVAEQYLLMDCPAQPNYEGEPILKFLAAKGHLEALKVLVNRKRDLPNIECSNGLLPVHYAAVYGQKDTLQYLREVTTADIYSDKYGTGLLECLIYGNLYDIALDLLKSKPRIGRDRIKYRKKVLEVMAEKPFVFANGRRSRLGLLQCLIYDCIPVKKEHVSSIQTDDNQTADDGDLENPIARSKSHSKKSPTFESIRQITTAFGAMCHKLHMMLWNALMYLVPSIKYIHEQKVKHMQAVEIVGIICKGVIWNNPQNQELIKNVFFKAARLGIFEFVQKIIEADNGSVYWLNEEKNTIFHVAVSHRRAEVFNLIHSSNFKLNRLGETDNDGNNSLHSAGRFVPSSEVRGAALQMQRELQWFKAVEDLVHPWFREAENKQHQTPRDVFTKEHKDLVKEGGKRMKETASSCSVVAALIITVMFAAAFTIPGGNDSRGMPNFLHELSFIIFAVSDALSLFSSIISVLMFLGILTSHYTEEDFLLSLPRKLIIGLIAMFFSIASMMVAFGATIYLVLFRTWKWVFIPISLVGFVPVTLFALLQFPLLVDMYSSTYGRGIFGSK